MRLLKFALILATTICVSACGSSGPYETNSGRPAGSPAAATPTTTPDELASSREHFEKYCAECHGAKGEGGRKELDGKSFKVPSLREGHALDHTDEKFVVQISEGDDEMPAFKDKLTPAQINDLVRFVRKEFQGK
jgi:mono/diheme cytochrome c family protein